MNYIGIKGTKTINRYPFEWFLLEWVINSYLVLQLNNRLTAIIRPTHFPGLVLTLILLTNTCYGQALDGSRFLKWLGADSKALVNVPSASTLLYTGAGLLSLTVLSTQDSGFNHELQEDYSGRFADYVNATNNLGDPRMNFVAAGIFGASLLTNSNRFQDAAFTSLESFAMAGLINTSIRCDKFD